MLTIISQLIIGIIDLGAAFLFMYGLKAHVLAGDGSFGNQASPG